MNSALIDLNTASYTLRRSLWSYRL